MTLMSVDTKYRGCEYRLAEPERENGHACVTVISHRSRPVECSRCHRVFNGGSRLVLFGVFAFHPGCAIRAGALVHMDRCQEQDTADAALAEYERQTAGGR